MSDVPIRLLSIVFLLLQAVATSGAVLVVGVTGLCAVDRPWRNR